MVAVYKSGLAINLKYPDESICLHVLYRDAVFGMSCDVEALTAYLHLAAWVVAVTVSEAARYCI